jgi:hypothetical protein
MIKHKAFCFIHQLAEVTEENNLRNMRATSSFFELRSKSNETSTAEASHATPREA